ncbi:MAG: tetratricopeptide (TPR) repeat protein [Myxococcota bacterium]|jgi:tetratricopeptide (TPR) repeat protein
MDLTPEQCFEHAMKFIERGKTDKAIKLLQIATLRAPGEGRYREALQSARNLKESSLPPQGGQPGAAPEPTTASKSPPEVMESEAAASTLAEASAEELYQRALTLREEGNIERAARMMQIAAAKAPGEAKYREGVDSIRRPGGISSSATEEQLQRALQMSSYDEVERLLRDALRENRNQAEKLQTLALLLFRIRDDARGALGPIRESVRLAPRRLSGLVLLEDILRALGDRTEATRTAKTIREITTDASRLEKARQRLNERIPVPGAHAASAAPVSSASVPGRSPALLGGVMAGLLITLGGIWFMGQPDRVDIAPYESQLPVISATSPVPSELVMRIAEDEWRKLERPEQESRLRGVMAEASSQGYQAVFLHGEQDTLLGSVRGGKTFLPK